MRFLFSLFVKITGWPAYFLAFRKKVYYEDKKAQSRRIKGKAIVISNHHTVMDYALMLYVFYGRLLRCQIAELMFKRNPFFTFLLKGLGGIKVDRDAHDFSFIGKSLKILEKGGVVEIFPEARIPKAGEQKPLPFKPSAAYIALHGDAPIIPVYLTDGYFKKQRARVIIGKPIYVKEYYNDTLSEKENLEIISGKLRAKVVELKYELERQIEEKNKKKTR